jgi:kynurenine formamidase
MLKGRILIIVLLALGVAPVARAQQPIELKFSRVVDLTLPIESNMPGIPGIKTYADNPSKVDVVTAINEAQKSQLQTEGMTLNSNLAVNGRAMISVLSILVHNGTHIDAPRHMMEKGSPIDQMPLGQLVKEGVLINVPNKGPNSVVTVKDIEESGVEL